jgi:hypothetical protein
MIAINTVKNPKSNWEAQKAKLKLKFPKLTEADLNFDETNKYEMLKHLEPKLAIPPEELLLIMESL